MHLKSLISEVKGKEYEFSAKREGKCSGCSFGGPLVARTDHSRRTGEGWIHGALA